MGKQNKVTITNDSGRLSREEIEKMVQDAEKYKAEDEAMKNKVEARNGFENYLYQMKNTLCDEKLKQAFTDEDKITIESTANENLQWPDGNQDAEADVIEGKRKESEAKFNPIMTRVYQAAGNAEMPDAEMKRQNGGAPKSAASDVGVDDLD